MPSLNDIYALRSGADYTNPRSEGDLLPIVYGDLTVGGVGGVWTAPCIDTVNYVYAVAGCALLSVADGNSVQVFDKDGVEISSGWTFNEADNYESQGTIATLTFSGDQEANEPITIRCKGRDDGSGNLLETPPAIAEDFLINLCGYASTDLHATALARAKLVAASQGYAAAGLIHVERTIGESLRELLSCFYATAKRDPAGLVRIGLDAGRGAVRENDIVASLRCQQTQDASVRASLADLTNQVVAEYAYNWAAGDYQAKDDGASTRDLKSQSRYGVRSTNYSWPWIRTAAVAQAMQQVIVDTFKAPARQIQVPLPSLRHAPLELGDLLLLSSDWILDDVGAALINQMCKVRSIQLELDGRSMVLDLLDTGFFKTIANLADGTCTAGGAIKAGGDRDLTDY